VLRSANAYDASSVQVTDLYTQSAFSGGIVDQQTKAEKNRENHNRKRANKIMKRVTKSNELFRCPWCSETRPCSADILRHMFVILIKLGPNLLIKCDRSDCSHAFTKALSNTQVKSLKRAHQDELVAKLQDLSIP
jgi:lysine-specific demethylase 3